MSTKPPVELTQTSSEIRDRLVSVLGAIPRSLALGAAPTSTTVGVRGQFAFWPEGATTAKSLCVSAQAVPPVYVWERSEQGGAVSSTAPIANTLALRDSEGRGSFSSTSGTGVAAVSGVAALGGVGVSGKAVLEGVGVRGETFGTGKGVEGISSSGAGLWGHSVNGVGVVANGGIGSGLRAMSLAGAYIAEFFNGSTEVISILRGRGWFRWRFSLLTGTLKTADITAHRAWTLPDASGTVGLVENTMPLATTVTSAPVDQVIGGNASARMMPDGASITGTLSLAGRVYSYVSVLSGPNQILLSTGGTAALNSILTAINAPIFGSPHALVRAAVTGGSPMIVFTAITEGAAGNDLTISSTGSGFVISPNFTGGAAGVVGTSGVLGQTLIHVVGTTLTPYDCVGVNPFRWQTAASAGATWSTLSGKPTTRAGFGLTDAQPLDSDLSAIAGLATTTFGRSLLIAADSAALRTSLTLGTLAAKNSILSADVSDATSGSVNGNGPTEANKVVRFNTLGGLTLEGLKVFKFGIPSSAALSSQELELEVYGSKWIIGKGSGSGVFRNSLPNATGKVLALTDAVDGSVQVTWSNISGKPTSFTAATHTHTMGEIENFPAVSASATPNSLAQRDSKGRGYFVNTDAFDAVLDNAAVRGTGTGASVGVFGKSATGSGVVGVVTDLNAAQANGVFGKCAGSGTGVRGEAVSLNGVGVIGQNFDQGVAISGNASGGGLGVEGNSQSGIGVEGNSETGTGVAGNGENGIGVSGTGGAINPAGIGVKGTSVAGTGVRGVTSQGTAVAGIATTTGFGVEGVSPQGIGVLGTSTAGDGGQFRTDSGWAIVGQTSTGGLLRFTHRYTGAPLFEISGAGTLTVGNIPVARVTGMAAGVSDALTTPAGQEGAFAKLGSGEVGDFEGVVARHKLSVEGGVWLSVESPSTNATLTISSRYLQNYTGSGEHTLTLPLAADAFSSSDAGLVFVVKNAGEGQLTVAAAVGDSIFYLSSGPSVVLQIGESLTFHCSSSGEWSAY